MKIVNEKYSVREIAKDISVYITENELPAGTRLAPSRKLAERYNVSEITVNRAIKKLVEKGLVYRVQGNGTFVAGRKYVGSPVRVGFFVWRHNKTNPFEYAAFGIFEDTLLKELDELGFTVDFIPKLPPHDFVFNGEYLVKYDLMIIPAGMVTPQTSPLLEKMGLPLITIFGEGLLEYPFHQVFQDYRPGFQKAMNFIRSRGHRKIYIASLDEETSSTRASVAIECAARADLICEELPNNKSTQGISSVIMKGREYCKYFWDNKLDGVIFSVSDFLSFGILDVVKEQNLELGRDIKLLSYDNLESRGVCPFDEPVLTCITHPLLEMAKETVHLVKDVYRNNTKCGEANKIIRVPARELVIRKSLQ